MLQIVDTHNGAVVKTLLGVRIQIDLPASKVLKTRKATRLALLLPGLRSHHCPSLQSKWQAPLLSLTELAAEVVGP